MSTITLDYLHIEQCRSCAMLFDHVDSDTDLCDECLYEYQEEQYYKHGIGEELEEAV